MRYKKTKTIIAILTVGTMALGGLANALWNPSTNKYDIALAPKDTKEVVLETPVFNSPREASEFIPSTPYENEKVRIKVYLGNYPANETTPTLTLENKELIGVHPVNPITKLDARKYLATSLEGAVINDTIITKSNSRVENIITSKNKNPNTFYFIMLGNPDLTSCSVVNNYFSQGNNLPHISLRAGGVNNVNLTGNIFADGSGAGFSWLYAIGTPTTQDDSVRLIGNVFYANEYGFVAKDINKLFLGDLTTLGNNIFVRNTWNGKLENTLKTIKAQGNFWYGKSDDTTLKTTEADILATINVLSSTPTLKYGEAIKPIEVMPCHTTEPFSPSAVKGWEKYE